MNKILTTAIFSLLLIMTGGQVSAGPRISLSEASFNFGKTAQHTNVSHTFWIKSTGDEELVITKVIPGCGCTKAPLTDSTLAPGDSAALEIIFSTKSYRGYVSKKPYVETNISDERVYLRIDAELIPKPDSQFYPIRIEPYKVDVSQFSEKPRRKAKFSITNISDTDLELKLIDDNNKKFKVDLPGKIKAGETAEGMIDVYEEYVDDEFDQSITFELNDANRSRYSLPVRRIIRNISAKN